jgi:hypothetical protein
MQEDCIEQYALELLRTARADGGEASGRFPIPTPTTWRER